MSEFWGLILGMVGIDLTMVGAVIAMMFWSRSEANDLRKEAKADRKDFLEMIRKIQFQMNSIESKKK